MANIETLHKILLSDKFCENFYAEYKNNREFRLWLNKILPEIVDCKMEQNNPWHIYNVLNHILHSVEEMNKLSAGYDEKSRLNLAMTMFLHDIGKPSCHIKRMKNGKMIDSFFNHGIVSTKIAERVLPQFGFSKCDTGLISALIYKHDIFMFIDEKQTNNSHHRPLSQKLMKEEINFFEKKGMNGVECMKKLLLVGRADSLAQNPEMTKNALRLLNAMTALLKSMQDEEREL